MSHHNLIEHDESEPEQLRYGVTYADQSGIVVWAESQGHALAIANGIARALLSAPGAAIRAEELTVEEAESWAPRHSSQESKAS